MLSPNPVVLGKLQLQNSPAVSGHRLAQQAKLITTAHRLKGKNNI